MDLEGATVDHVSEPDANPPYAYMMTGTEANSFYLAQVYWPDQSKAKVAEYIKKAATSKITEEGYKDGKYLGEFDYCEKSGWMYSIADRMTGNPSFPGVGAADWRLSDGEVMRWQFTVWGYGADLNADNSAWGQPSITGNSGDKTELTVMIAELRQVYGDKPMDNGISDGTNMPGVITREQLATILYRYAKQKGYDVSKSAALTAFSDADKVSGYAAEAMQWAVAEELLKGSNGKLNPQGSATRAQVATILMRFMENIAK